MTSTTDGGGTTALLKVDNKASEEEEESEGLFKCKCCLYLDDFAVLLNGYIEAGFSAVGYIIGSWPYLVLGLTLLFLGLCCIGYLFVEIETQLFDLWTPTDSPVFKEQNFIDYYWSHKDYGLSLITGYAKAGEDTNILTQAYIEEWNELHVDLTAQLPTKDYHYNDPLDNSPQTVTFSYFAENYDEAPELTTLSAWSEQGLGPTKYPSEVVPLCRPISQSPAEGQFIMPCYVATIMDCFTEGGLLFPYEEYLQHTQLSLLIPANMYTYARDSYQGKDTIELGEILAGSCAGITNVRWPPNFIYGGEKRVNDSDAESTLISLSSFQIALFTDSAYNIARKMKIIKGECLYTSTFGIACDDVTEKERNDAQDFLDEWILDYIDYIEDYATALRKDESKLFNIVYWTPRTTGDLLRSASSADYGLLVIAYLIMIIFASLTAINFSNAFLSRSEASFAGVLLVLFAVVASIGLGSFLQIPLSPNIVQVLPFIALGFGVDDMFILLFSFKYRSNLSVAQMMAETIRIAGSSVALTSLANFLGFVIGTTMVLPDVSRFASFGAIVVLINFIALIFGFTAVLTLVARRMHHEKKYRDWSFLCCWAEFTEASNPVRNEAPSAQSDSLFDPLFDWLTKTYTRIVMLVMFFALIIVGIIGCTQMLAGLPLYDIVPSDHYASDFLRIRQKYYSSYPLSIYTDADNNGALRSIDWPNKFETWLQNTRDEMYSISDAVYSASEKVHSFWAWSMQKYLEDKYDESLVAHYELSETFDIEAALSDDVVYQQWMCFDDVAKYCSTEDRDYEYGSDLFNCLLLNYQLNNLQTNCYEYVKIIYLENTADERAVAKQIYITSNDDDADIVNGLYVRPSSNDIKVFIKQPNEDGYIYQTSCGMDLCQWYLLDDEFNILYIGRATSASDSEAPSQAGWRDADGNKAAMTHQYYDFIVEYLGNARDTEDIFMSGDYTPSTIFTFSSKLTTTTTNVCTQWEVMRLLMADSDAFSEVSMSESSLTHNSNDVTCDAILESSEICRSIRDGSYLGSVYCGYEETLAAKNLWYAGNRSSDGLYQIVSTPNNSGASVLLDASSTIFENCDDSSLWTASVDSEITVNFTYNYFAPCGSLDDFGGFGVSQSSQDSFECASLPQDIEIVCSALSDCDDLKACYSDWESLSAGDTKCLDLVADYDEGFRKQKLSTYELIIAIAECSFKYYSQVSDCCRSAIDSQILSLPQFPCSAIVAEFGSNPENYAESFEAVCRATDNCAYDGEDLTCTEVATNDVFNDCFRIISGVDSKADCSLSTLNITHAQIRGGKQEDFYNCMSVAVSKSLPKTYGVLKRSGSDSCESVFAAQSAIYGNCLYPVDSFYDLEEQKYDFAMCSDYDLSAIKNGTCGDVYNEKNETQLNCLIANVDAIEDGCCKLCIEQISEEEHSYAFTNECGADTRILCSSFGISSAASAIVAASARIEALHPITKESIYPGELCMAALLSASLSPKCAASVINCELTADGLWPTTVMGETASIDCAKGFNGTRHRMCSPDAEIPASWSEIIDESECVPLTCSEIFADDDNNIYDQYWPQTSVGSVYKIQGGYINNNGDIDTDHQISNKLQDLYSDLACDPIDGNNIWYARRRCILAEDDNIAQWQDPIVECKPFMALWENNIMNHTICDFITEEVTSNLASYVNDASLLSTTTHANLMFAIVWSMYDDEYNDGVATNKEAHITLSQTFCSLKLTKCAAFTYDNIFGITYFFDYCGPTLNSDSLRTEAIAGIVESAAYEYGAIDYLASVLSGLLNVTITKYHLTSWAFYPDPVYDLFWPDPVFAAAQSLSSFADRHETHIAPLTQSEFIASYCSLKSISAADEDVFLSPQFAWSQDGIPAAPCFNNLLWLFFMDPTGNGVIKRDSMYFVDATQVSNMTGFDNVEIVTTSNTIIVHGIDDDSLAVEFIVDLRARLKKWRKEDEIYAIPSGLIIKLFSQYINVSSYLVTNLVFVSIAIAACGLLFLLSPVAVLVAIACNTAMVIEVYGFSHWFGLRVNGVLVLNIVIAVALTMEFTAHLGRAFVLSTVTDSDRRASIALPFSNNGQIRMKKTLREMFAPVSLGAITTLIGVSPIAAAQFPYFRQYYFTLYVMIVLFGWLNGVIFQPVILSFIPPKPFINKQKQSQTQVIDNNNNNNNNNNDVHEPLVQHQENAKQVKKQTINPIMAEAKTELVKRRHTRNVSDAP